MQQRVCTNPGFSLLEVLLVMAMITVVSATILPQLGTFQKNHTAHTVAQDVYQALYQAQSRTVHGYRDSPWGVAVFSGSYTIFAGSSFNTRLNMYDETSVLQKPFTLSGSGEVAFQRPHGTSSGASFLVEGTSVSTYRIHVSPIGRITFASE